MPTPETTPRFKASLNGLAPALKPDLVPTVLLVPGTMLFAVFAKVP